METKLRNLLPKMMPGAVCSQMIRSRASSFIISQIS